MWNRVELQCLMGSPADLYVLDSMKMPRWRFQYRFYRTVCYIHTVTFKVTACDLTGKKNSC